MASSVLDVRPGLSPQPAASAVLVVAVHGNGGGGERFEAAAPHMPAGSCLVAPTLPGFGRRPLEPRVRSLADYARALAEVVEVLPRPRVVLGHGVGGSIVLELAQRRADLLDGMILHAPVGARLDRRWFPRVMRYRAVRLLVRRALVSTLVRPLLSRRMFRSERGRRSSEQFFEAYRHCAAFDAMFELITPEWFAALRPTDTPTALLWGMSENVLAWQHIDDFRRLAPRAHVRLVPGWGHFPMLDEPVAYAETVTELARLLVGADSGVDHAA